MSLADHLHRAKDCISPQDTAVAKPTLNSSLNWTDIPVKCCWGGKGSSRVLYREPQLVCYRAEHITCFPGREMAVLWGAVAFLPFLTGFLEKNSASWTWWSLKGFSNLKNSVILSIQAWGFLFMLVFHVLLKSNVSAFNLAALQVINLVYNNNISGQPSRALIQVYGLLIVRINHNSNKECAVQVWEK